MTGPEPQLRVCPEDATVPGGYRQQRCPGPTGRALWGADPRPWPRAERKELLACDGPPAASTVLAECPRSRSCVSQCPLATCQQS